MKDLSNQNNSSSSLFHKTIKTQFQRTYQSWKNQQFAQSRMFNVCSMRTRLKRLLQTVQQPMYQIKPSSIVLKIRRANRSKHHFHANYKRDQVLHFFSSQNNQKLTGNKEKEKKQLKLDRNKYRKIQIVDQFSVNNCQMDQLSSRYTERDQQATTRMASSQLNGWGAESDGLDFATDMAQSDQILQNQPSIGTQSRDSTNLSKTGDQSQSNCNYTQQLLSLPLVPPSITNSPISIQMIGQEIPVLNQKVQAVTSNKSFLGTVSARSSKDYLQQFKKYTQKAIKIQRRDKQNQHQKIPINNSVQPINQIKKSQTELSQLEIEQEISLYLSQMERGIFNQTVRQIPSIEVNLTQMYERILDKLLM